MDGANERLGLHVTGLDVALEPRWLAVKQTSQHLWSLMHESLRHARQRDRNMHEPEMLCRRADTSPVECRVSKRGQMDRMTCKRNTHTTAPPAYSTVGVIGLPSAPIFFLMSRVANEFETVMKRETSATCLPGQIRRPKPNAYARGSSSGFGPRKRSGRNSSGFL